MESGYTAEKRGDMRALMIMAMLAISAALAGAGSAATKKRQYVAERSPSTVVQPTRTIIHNPNGTTTIIVTPRRSYLDPGTEVSPGEEKSTDYMLPPGGDPGRPNWFYGPDTTGSGGYPLPRPFDLPGFNPATPY